MSAVVCACPRCQTQLQITRSLPAQVQCPRCRAVFTAGPPAAPPAPATTPSPDGLVVRRPRKTGARGLTVFLFSAAGVLGIAAVILLVALNRKTQQGPPDAPAPPQAKQDARQLKINHAIDRGVAYLKKQILEDTRDYYFNDPGGGSHTGAVALAGLTLLECGVPSGDPAVQKAIKTVRDAEPDLRFTYSLALAVLFLDRWYEAKDRPPESRDRELIQRYATRLIASQNQNGGWGYYCDPIAAQQHQQILTALNAGQSVPRLERAKDDNSINQFVTHALWAARKHGVKTDTCLLLTEKRYRDNQNGDGSWGYRARDDGFLRDATTCAGLIGLAVGQGVRNDQAKEKKDPKKPEPPPDMLKDPAVKKAVDYLKKALERNPKQLSDKVRKERYEHTQEMLALYKQWQETRDPERRKELQLEIDRRDKAWNLKGTYMGADAWGDLYFLWSVERVAVIFDWPTVAGKDWYAWGADIILANQQPDGGWRDRFPGIADTCFALLFLKRANVAKDLTDKLVGRVPTPAIGAPPDRQPPPSVPPRGAKE